MVRLPHRRTITIIPVPRLVDDQRQSQAKTGLDLKSHRARQWYLPGKPASKNSSSQITYGGVSMQPQSTDSQIIEANT
jgi:hypothetical protein